MPFFSETSSFYEPSKSQKYSRVQFKATAPDQNEKNTRFIIALRTKFSREIAKF